MDKNIKYLVENFFDDEDIEQEITIKGTNTLDIAKPGYFLYKTPNNGYYASQMYNKENCVGIILTNIKTKDNKHSINIIAIENISNSPCSYWDAVKIVKQYNKEHNETYTLPDMNFYGIQDNQIILDACRENNITFINDQRTYWEKYRNSVYTGNTINLKNMKHKKYHTFKDRAYVLLYKHIVY